MRVFIGLISLLVFSNYYAQPLPCWGCPSVSAHESLKIYQGFTLSFNPSTKLANWVCYTLNPQKLSAPKVKRNNKFKPDFSLKGGTAKDADYKKSGFDKGHLAPAADMAWSQASMNDCFYYTNIAPQYPECNRGIWKKLEEQVRRLALICDSLIVFTGPVFNTHHQVLGISKIAIPSGFYKIIVLFYATDFKVYSVLIPNVKQFENFNRYACSLANIEKQTGLIFITNLNLPLLHDLKQNINLLSLYNAN